LPTRVALLTLPLVVDGVTHLISDFAGVGQGFRYSNEWLATLTGNALAPGFYAGTELGSFNSWMRLVTGVLFGLAVAWVVYPALHAFFSEVRATLDSQLRRV
jgi:uncharacterized membrane protein